MQRLIPRRHHQRLALPVVLVGGISPIAVELVPLGHLHVRLERARFDVLTGRLEAIIARQAHHIVMLVGQRFVQQTAVEGQHVAHFVVVLDPRQIGVAQVGLEVARPLGMAHRQHPQGVRAVQYRQSSQAARHIAHGQPARPHLLGALDVDEVLVHRGGAERRARHHHARNRARVRQHRRIKQRLVEPDQTGVMLEALEEVAVL